MNMADAPDVFFQHRNRINSRKSQMTGVKQQEDQLRIHDLHEMVDLLHRLHARSHVMVTGQHHAFFLCQRTHLVIPLRNELPLLRRIDRFLIPKDIDVLSLNRIALLRGPDHPCAQRIQAVPVLDKVADRDLIGL